MQSQNLAEYKAIREEMAHVRSCITVYVRYVVMGSAPAFWFLAGRTSDQSSGLGMSFAPMLLSLGSLLILFLVSYKVTSCNRYAGYGKLLTHEHFVSKAPDRRVSSLLDRCIFYWEISLDRLRAADCDEGQFQELLIRCGQLNISSMPNLKEVVSSISKKDQLAWLRGWALLFSCWDKSGSWKLPLYIARIFGAINAILLFFAGYFLIKGGTYRQSSLGVSAIVVLYVLVIALWIVFIAKLYKQMLGSETVESFCCKFTPIRAQLLMEMSDDIEYRLRGVSINTTVSTEGAKATLLPKSQTFVIEAGQNGNSENSGGTAATAIRALESIGTYNGTKQEGAESIPL